MQHHLCKWYCEINVVVLLSVPNARFEFVGSVVRRIKFSRDHLFVAKNRKSKTKQNTRKQLSFWLTKNWCSGLKINVAETGPVLVWASVRVSDYNLPHWKAGTIAFALAIAMRGETRTQVVYRFVSFLPCFYYWTFSFLFCFVLFFSWRFSFSFLQKISSSCIYGNDA